MVQFEKKRARKVMNVGDTLLDKIKSKVKVLNVEKITIP